MEDWPSPGTVIGGRFQIEAQLGQGGMGAVFAAIDTATGRAVAIKFLAREISTHAMAVSRFMEEARATAKIEHPNVIQVIDVGRDGQHPFLVMERLRGESLRDRLMRERRLLPTVALDVLIPACRGVAEAHREGVIHRDLKPDNIFLSREGGAITPKVLDFGLAKTEERVVAQLTRTGATLGTPGYMSPEQLAKPREATPRFDIYAMGVVLYESLTGRLPYEGENVLAMVRQIAEGNAAPPRSIQPDVPSRLDAVVMRAMHVDPAQRHATMDELIRDLVSVQRGYGATLEAPVSAVPVTAMRTSPIERAIPTTGAIPIQKIEVQNIEAQKIEVQKTIPDTTGSARTSNALVIGAIGALLVLVPSCITASGVLAYLLWRPSTHRSAVTQEVEDTSADLTLRGDCHIDFSMRPTVVASANQITIAWGSASAIHIHSDRPPSGTQEVVNLAQQGNTFVMVVSDLKTWSSAPAFSLIPNQVGGRIRFHRLSPALGIVSLELIDVRLQGMSSMCTIDGTLRTFGPQQ